MAVFLSSRMHGCRKAVPHLLHQFFHRMPAAIRQHRRQLFQLRHHHLLGSKANYLLVNLALKQYNVFTLKNYHTKFPKVQLYF
jgi:hypothetical protein